jgi:hypothetical protein
VLLKSSSKPAGGSFASFCPVCGFARPTCLNPNTFAALSTWMTVPYLASVAAYAIDVPPATDITHVYAILEGCHPPSVSRSEFVHNVTTEEGVPVRVRHGVVGAMGCDDLERF